MKMHLSGFASTFVLCLYMYECTCGSLEIASAGVSVNRSSEQMIARTRGRVHAEWLVWVLGVFL